MDKAHYIAKAELAEYRAINRYLLISQTAHMMRAKDYLAAEDEAWEVLDFARTAVKQAHRGEKPYIPSSLVL